MKIRKELLLKIILILFTIVGLAPCLVFLHASASSINNLLVINYYLELTGDTIFELIPPLLYILTIIVSLLAIIIAIILVITCIGGWKFKQWSWYNIIGFSFIAIILFVPERLFFNTLKDIPVIETIYFLFFIFILLFFNLKKIKQCFIPEGKSDKTNRINIFSFISFSCLILIPISIVLFFKISLIAQNRDNLLYHNSTVLSNISDYKHLFDKESEERTIDDLSFKLPDIYAILVFNHYTESITLFQTIKEDNRFPHIIDISENISYQSTDLRTFQNEKHLYESSWDFSLMSYKYFIESDVKVYEYKANGFKGFIRIYDNPNKCILSIYDYNNDYLFDVNLISRNIEIDEKFIAFLLSNLSENNNTFNYFGIGMNSFSKQNYIDAQYAFVNSYLLSCDTESLYMLASSIFYYIQSQEIKLYFGVEQMIDHVLHEKPNHEGALELKTLID